MICMPVSGLKSGARLQSSRFRERLDRRRHGSANLKASFGCHQSMMPRSVIRRKRRLSLSRASEASSQALLNAPKNGT
jgi:hypothetical protein